jgi:hypothetical protein
MMFTVAQVAALMTGQAHSKQAAMVSPEKAIDRALVI